MIADGARHFEDFDGVTYLNCAAKGPIPLVSIQAIKDAIPLNSFPNRISDDTMFRIPNGLRSGVAPFIGAEPPEIIVGTGASHGVNIVALGFPWKTGDEIVVASNDFP
jgi:selenocysteine lyase/cysteine desulfurase